MRIMKASYFLLVVKNTSRADFHAINLRMSECTSYVSSKLNINTSRIAEFRLS